MIPFLFYKFLPNKKFKKGEIHKKNIFFHIPLAQFSFPTFLKQKCKHTTDEESISCSDPYSETETWTCWDFLSSCQVARWVFFVWVRPQRYRATVSWSVWSIVKIFHVSVRIGNIGIRPRIRRFCLRDPFRSVNFYRRCDFLFVKN